eukprot:8120685-Pyramimonas_sp.AAC.1
MSARYLSAGAPLERCAGELFEDVDVDRVAAMRLASQTGWAVLLRGNLRAWGSSRTATCLPIRIARWRGTCRF